MRRSSSAPASQSDPSCARAPGGVTSAAAGLAADESMSVQRTRRASATGAAKEPSQGLLQQRVPVSDATMQRAPGQGATPVLARPRRARRPPLVHHITIVIIQITVETGHTPADAPVLCASPAHREAGDRGFVPSGAPRRPIGSAWARRGRSPPTCQRAPVLAQLAEHGQRPLRLGRRRHHLRAGGALAWIKYSMRMPKR